MRFARFLLGLPLLVACNSTPSAVNEGTVSRMADRQRPAPAADTILALPAPDTAQAKAVSALSDTLRVVRARRNFSHLEGPADFFQLVFRGPSSSKATPNSPSPAPKAKVIFREMLTEPDLEAALVYEMKTPTATRAERETFVLRRINNFFQLTQFDAPAIDPKATFPTGIANLERSTWNELAQTPRSHWFRISKRQRRPAAHCMVAVQKTSGARTVEPTL